MAKSDEPAEMKFSDRCGRCSILAMIKIGHESGTSVGLVLLHFKHAAVATLTANSGPDSHQLGTRAS